MAVVSPMPATAPQINRTSKLRDVGVPGIMTSRSEIVSEPSPSMVDDTLYVAVAKDVKDSKLNLIWAIQNSGGRRICILHVHVPSPTIPMMGAKFPASALREQEVQDYHERERQNIPKTMDPYLYICQRMGVRAGKVLIEMDCVEKGIVELIHQYGIQRLVMGAASDKNYSRRMISLKSKKAIYVSEQAPASCHMQFVCNGYLIHTRDCRLDRGNVEVGSPVLQIANSEVGHSPNTGSPSSVEGQNRWRKPINTGQELFRRVRTINGALRKSIGSVSSLEGYLTPQRKFGKEASCDEFDEQSRGSPSVFSMCFESCLGEAQLIPDLINNGSENVLGLSLNDFSLDNKDLHSPSPSVLDEGMDDALYGQLEQAMAEAWNARKEAHQETVRRVKAEKEAKDAIRKAKATENLYQEELKLRKEQEEEVQKANEELDDMKSQINKVNEELQLALDQKLSLENQIASTELIVKELEQKNISADELSQKYRDELDELQMQLDNALGEAEELKRKQGESSSMHGLQPFSEFSFSEIKEATRNFNPSLKIGQGGYGSIFKGILRHTEVAIKMLSPDSAQGPMEFQQEVEILSRLRHPNLVTLIGSCPESWTLVYEYLPNGSLEDRLNCKDNTPPLSWQTRIRIAAELCSALIFLQSSKPHSIAHGDLKPGNILLDANLVTKLSDFGICRILSCQEGSSSSTTEFWRTVPKGTFVYVDPEFLISGELTPKSDVYSFGVILLRLITGKPALGITKEVQYALHSRKLKSILDPLAGDWPVMLAEELVRLALRCCEMNRKNRPDLHPDVWRILEPMRASCGPTQLGSQGKCQPPPYFICPISLEVMQDPQVAADGFTYEAEAIREWLKSGRHTSPRTKSKLAHHNLIPNHSLRHAIQDWLQTH
ncbi:U-box domain-containing protein 33-like isoform X1 [Vigna umbellata]|uniref:U-box domain-containing protein 33-like isoform X1 n=2 Tax=Vigna umbellata TaxID=87088 RepID=UPI001F5F56FC|nr:U-box domain-containing protein 33-like isoform X1 [Vigna umbellata]XP_047155093.1 U-box domain-containing protein 33-like isoform X1 [Vigna umbellata]XP_047155094.1 U-box domain-containing protein 33-like isoform X1 [Vigna umbellata]XP_047155095.1 U-box domain-containing protein 33-like isoform X1 [Vigna umbellata]